MTYNYSPAAPVNPGQGAAVMWATDFSKNPHLLILNAGLLLQRSGLDIIFRGIMSR